MSSSEFRQLLKDLGNPVPQSHHVCHIIAYANGGADHIDNYFVSSGQFNYATGTQHDGLNALHVGLEMAQRAVAVSRALRGYSGPDAETLIEEAREELRDIRESRLCEEEEEEEEEDEEEEEEEEEERYQRRQYRPWFRYRYRY
jgi:hypothetical protein